MPEQVTAAPEDRPRTEQHDEPMNAKERAERARRRARTLWRTASGALRKPAIGAGVAGATVLAAGALLGVTEAALAAVAAWAVFRTLTKRGVREAAAEGG